MAQRSRLTEPDGRTRPTPPPPARHLHDARCLVTIDRSLIRLLLGFNSSTKAITALTRLQNIEEAFSSNKGIPALRRRRKLYEGFDNSDKASTTLKNIFIVPWSPVQGRSVLEDVV